MINAIYSNLISLLWAQAESRVPTLWLCTWLCWFFLYYRFSFVFITDSRIFSVGDTVWVCRRGSLKSAVTRPARRWIQGVFEAIPNSACLLVLQHFCTKDTKCAARLTYSQFSAFWKCPHRKTSTSHISNPCNLILLLHPKNGSRHGPGTGEECFVKTGSSFYWLFIGARDGERTLRHLLSKEAAG